MADKMRYKSKAIGTVHMTFFRMKCEPTADKIMLPIRINFMAFSFQLKFENLKENFTQNVKNYTETMRHKGRNLRKNITKLNEKKLNAEVQEALEKKETEYEVIENLKEVAEELVGYTKKAKKLRTDEEIFKVDAARKFRDAKKSMQAKKYKGLRLADVIRSAKEKIIEEASAILNTNGLLYLEIHEDYAQEIKDIAFQNNFKNVEIRKDLQGKNRMIKAQNA